MSLKYIIVLLAKNLVFVRLLALQRIFLILVHTFVCILKCENFLFR